MPISILIKRISTQPRATGITNPDTKERKARRRVQSEADIIISTTKIDSISQDETKIGNYSAKGQSLRRKTEIAITTENQDTRQENTDLLRRN